VENEKNQNHKGEEGDHQKEDSFRKKKRKEAPKGEDQPFAQRRGEKKRQCGKKKRGDQGMKKEGKKTGQTNAKKKKQEPEAHSEESQGIPKCMRAKPES